MQFHIQTIMSAEMD